MKRPVPRAAAPRYRIAPAGRFRTATRAPRPPIRSARPAAAPWSSCPKTPAPAQRPETRAHRHSASRPARAYAGPWLCRPAALHGVPMCRPSCCSAAYGYTPFEKNHFSICSIIPRFSRFMPQSNRNAAQKEGAPPNDDASSSPSDTAAPSETIFRSTRRANSFVIIVSHPAKPAGTTASVEKTGPKTTAAETCARFPIHEEYARVRRGRCPAPPSPCA